jgi:tricorn protease
VWSVPATSGITRNITQTGTVHEREVNWSPDGKWMAYISDASGEDEIYVRPQKGDGAATRISTNGDNYKYHMSWSPDSKKILWSDRHQTLYYADIASKQITTIDHSDSGEYIFYKWSPDSKWVAYVRPEFKQFNRAFLYSLTTKTSTPVTDGWYAVYEPTFSSDGKYLILASDRDFNPTFSNIEFEIAYSNLTKVYLIPLAKSTSSPLTPKDDEVKASSDTSKAAAAPSAKKSSKTAKPSAPAPSTKDITVDLGGIANRLIALPTDPAQYQNLESVDGKIYYLRQKTGSPATTLVMYSLDDRK